MSLVTTRPTFDRQTFSISRAAEYFDVRELEKLTGQSQDKFAAVVLKELLDNALDAAETAGCAPELEIEVSRSEDLLTLAINDNGTGLPQKTVERILDFNTRTSDKAVYKTPTRGAQGNALKTILGLPFALKVNRPVVIEAQGLKHTIKAFVNPAGAVKTEHSTAPSSRTVGTRVELSLPTASPFDARGWGRAFSIFNPHASVKILVSEKAIEHANTAPQFSDSYRNSVDFPNPWRKFLPTDLPSAWWFSLPDLERLVYAHITAAHEGGEDPTLRDFVRRFRGLRGTAKAKAVTEQLPGISRVSDFEISEHLIEKLHEAMREAAPAPSANVLGLVGPKHFERCFKDWYGVKRYWYKQVTEVIDGMPFAFEVAVAETVKPGGTYHALNFSPTFDDPLKGVYLEAGKVTSRGAENFLKEGRALSSGDWPVNSAVAYHLASPALTMLDRGKSNVHISTQQAEKIADALWKACKDLHKDFKRAEKDAAAAERYDRERYRAYKRQELNIKEAVFYVLDDAYQAATENGIHSVSVRDLFYVVREKIQAYTGKTLEFNRFSQNLIVDYQRLYKPFELLYYKPRGILYEPHTQRETPLGTREVRDYSFPDWVYNKVLYVEKAGVGEGLKPLADRYDMAIISAEGYASEAARVLLSKADKNQSYQLFVLHDADPHGYNIARTLSEETRRMPGHSIEVIDLGLKLEEALAIDLLTEEFTRKTALPKGLRLTPKEREYFEGRPSGYKSWICQRVELNALTPGQRLKYVEAKLIEHGATAKVIPPADVVTDTAREKALEVTRSAIREQLDKLLAFDSLAAALADELLAETVEGVTPETITEVLEVERGDHWRQAVARPLRAALQTEASRQVINDAITKVITEAAA